MDSVDTYVEKVNGYGSKNIGMEDIGNTLAGDYNPKMTEYRVKQL